MIPRRHSMIMVELTNQSSHQLEVRCAVLGFRRHLPGFFWGCARRYRSVSHLSNNQKEKKPERMDSRRKVSRRLTCSEGAFKGGSLKLRVPLKMGKMLNAGGLGGGCVTGAATVENRGNKQLSVGWQTGSLSADRALATSTTARCTATTEMQSMSRRRHFETLNTNSLVRDNSIG